MRNSLRFRRFRALAGWLVAMSSLIASGACAKSASVDVVLLDPSDFRAQAAFEQLAIFEGGCPPDLILANGAVESATQVQTVPVGGEFADIGPLKKSSYGFAVLLRKDDCTVVAAGCTPVDLNVHRHVAIQVDAVIPPAGKCNTAAGESCVGGLCQPGSK